MSRAPERRRPAVRLARASDAAAIADAQIRGWQVTYRGLVPDLVLDGVDVPRRTAWWAQHVAEPGTPLTTRTWVIEAPGGVAGFVSAGPARAQPAEPPPGAGEVYAIYLRPERRGEGYGRALFVHAIAELQAAGFDPLLVWVFEANPRARAFYEASGFVADGARAPVRFGELEVPEIRYRLDRAGSAPP